MIQILSLLSTAVVFFGLLYIAQRRPALLIKPSTLILAFFFLQVQVGAAINADHYIADIQRPWTFFFLIHGFALFCLVVVLRFQTRRAEVVFERVGEVGKRSSPGAITAALIAVLTATYLVVAVYLAYVPWNKTGLYAAFFEPAMHDSYRQLSMRLLSAQWLQYLFTIMEKVLAPLAGGLSVILSGVLWRSGRRGLAILAAMGVLLAIFPAMIYGARGPGAMVLVAALFAGFLAFMRKVTVLNVVMAALIVLTPPILIMVGKSQSASPKVIAFQVLNVLDRTMLRSYVEDVTHFKYVEEYGYRGIGAIEKLAGFFGEEPVDVFNEVARHGSKPPPSWSLTENIPGGPPVVEGVSINEAVSCDPAKNPDCVDIRESASANASFVVMNYVMFGIPGILLSMLFVLAIDMLLWVYERLDDAMLTPVIAAAVVPCLALSFSLMTTVLASKGILLIPLIGWVIGWAIKHLPRVKRV